MIADDRVDDHELVDDDRGVDLLEVDDDEPGVALPDPGARRLSLYPLDSIELEASWAFPKRPCRPSCR